VLKVNDQRNEAARILIIDDDEGIRQVLTSILQQEGYVIDSAKDGKEAIEKTNTNFYNLALVDINLPDLRGIDLLASMKETTPKMAKIIVTGYPSTENAVAALNKDADAYLIKPFDINDLLHKIKFQLEKQQKSKKLSEAAVVTFIETRVKELEHQTTNP
jgi:two-component system response regulator PilR (NtrC family)